MASSFRPFLVNELFGDPALYVSLPWERRALLFDLGDISHLSAGRLLKISDVFYCEAAYPDRDAARAGARFHLTARQAGRLAAAAGARHLAVFHLSPKYRECPGELLSEAMAAFTDDGARVESGPQDDSESERGGATSRGGGLVPS